MADPKWHDLQAINEKVAAYLESHRKITGDFERSLRNARRYVELAEVAKDKEPAETVTMLEQIREIDLRGHLQNQFDAFQEISSLLGPEVVRALTELWLLFCEHCMAFDPMDIG